MVATAVADLIPDRIRSLIYFDAALPQDGQAMPDFVSAERKQSTSVLRRNKAAASRSLADPCC